ncbi:hypothetical protein [Tautonia rosea]|uniref:hypothetical protein n=1 Tax=Tautonia rosea TaxID=2728037 RepID=UPI001475AF37|nr:hypothetical protein [Tautonia rosea]
MNASSMDERIGPDCGPVTSAGLAVGLAGLTAIAAASMTAIALSAAFELASILPRSFEQYRLIDAGSRFAAEASALIVLILTYRSGRGRSLWPRRRSILGMMKVTAFLGVIASRFLYYFSPWIS